MRKLSLLFAAALMACVFQTAYAAEGRLGAADEITEGFRPGMAGNPMPTPVPPPMGHKRGHKFGPGPDFDGDMGLGHFGMMGHRLFGELDLTADQKAKIIDTATQSFRERLELRWEMAEAVDRLGDLKDAEKPDYNAIVAANEALGSIKGKLDVARRQVKDQFEAILTPEQRQKIDQFKEEIKAKREERKDMKKWDRENKPGKPQPKKMR